MGDGTHQAGVRIEDGGIELGLVSPLRIRGQFEAIAHPDTQCELARSSPVVLHIELVRPPARQIVGDEVGKAGGSDRSEQERGEGIAGVWSVWQAASAGAEI